MIEAFTRVALTTDLPDWKLKLGDTGTVVDVLAKHNAYIVEFMTILGKTIAVVEVRADQVRPIVEDEMVSARPLLSA
jgi:hypothetical protein